MRYVPFHLWIAEGWLGTIWSPFIHHLLPLPSSLPPSPNCLLISKWHFDTYCIERKGNMLKKKNMKMCRQGWQYFPPQGREERMVLKRECLTRKIPRKKDKYTSESFNQMFSKPIHSSMWTQLKNCARHAAVLPTLRRSRIPVPSRGQWPTVSEHLCATRRSFAYSPSQ